MSKNRKIKYYLCKCGRRVQLDGVKVMRHRKPGSSEYCEEGAKSVLTTAMEATNADAKARQKLKDNMAMVSIKCMFPPCPTEVMVKAPPPGVTKGSPQHMSTMGGIPMCAKHGDMLSFHVWATMNIKLQKQQTPHGIIVPGHEKFNPTLNQQEVKP